MALVVSLGFTYFLFTRMKRQFAKAASISVVMSARALEAGTQLSADDLKLAEWPKDVPLSGIYTQPDKLIGRIVMFPVPAQEPIRDSILAGEGSAVGLNAKIPDGMRAVAVVTNEVNNVSGFLFPGSHVDVLVTLKEDGPIEPMTTTVLQNVEVLSTGERLQPDPSGKPQNVRIVTVLLNPDDAQKLMLASNQGTVQFVLRNSADQAEVKSRPVDIKEIRGTPAPAKPLGRTGGPPRITVYEVETFDGAKKSVVKF